VEKTLRPFGPRDKRNTSYRKKKKCRAREKPCGLVQKGERRGNGRPITHWIHPGMRREKKKKEKKTNRPFVYLKDSAKSA